jgi:hypothetical protein
MPWQNNDAVTYAVKVTSPPRSEGDSELVSLVDVLHVRLLKGLAEVESVVAVAVPVNFHSSYTAPELWAPP